MPCRTWGGAYNPPTRAPRGAQREGSATRVMSWLHRERKGVKSQPAAEKRELPEGLWTKFRTCSDIIYRIELEKSVWVCGRCNYHFSIDARQYVDLLTDPGSFVEQWREITSLDPLDFRDAKEKYRLKLKKAM